MQISSRSEWMEDQKQAVIMAPGKAFEVIVTPSGRSVFFSIGTDNIFYATREVENSATGWTRIDLTSHIKSIANRTLAAKSFAVTQNAQSLSFDIALVMTAADGDYLYLSLGNTNAEDAWEHISEGSQLNWLAVPFDAGSHNKDNISIEGIYLLNLPTSGRPLGTQTCFVDILKGTTDSNRQRLLERYYISTTGQARWIKRTLPIDLVAGSISMCTGRPSGQRVGGIYTLGKIGSKAEVIFGPAYDAWDAQANPTPTRMQVSGRTTSIATSVNAEGTSALFFSSEQGISVFTAENQKESSVSTLILQLPSVRSASQLSADTNGGITALYGVSVHNELFYATCPAGKEGLPSAWSVPMTLIASVQTFSFFINRMAASNTVFALQSGTGIFQLTQDPMVRDWATSSILLPTTDIKQTVRFDAFATRITVQNDQHQIASNTSLMITAESPVGVYVNNAYQVLDSSTPFQAVTDSAGVVKLSQPTQDSVAVSYQVWAADGATAAVTIDPAVTAKDKLASIRTRQDLDNARVQLPDGTTRPLIPSDVKGSDRDAAVTAIQALLQASSNLPQAPNANSPRNETNTSNSGDVQQLLKITPPGSSTSGASVASAAPANAALLRVSIGDLFRSMIYTAWEGIKTFALNVVDGVHRVIVDIGNTVYEAVLDCVAAVSHAIEWVLSRLKVAIDDLRGWLGFAFSWNDIIRTHRVIKNVATTYARHGISRIGQLRGTITGAMDGMESSLNTWAGLPTQDKSLGDLESTSLLGIPGANDPQTHFIHDKVEAHLNQVPVIGKALADAAGDWTSILDRLLGFAIHEKDAIVQVIAQIKSEIIEPFRSLSITEVIKRLIGIIGNLVLETAKNVVDLTLGLLGDVGNAIIDGLNKTIEIPILSQLYKQIADEDLSIMDLVCLAAAVPATLIYKAITGETPFPDNKDTDALIHASEYTTVQSMMLADAPLNKKFTILCEFAAMAGLFLDVVSNGFKLPFITAGKPHEVSDTLKQVSVGVKLLVLMPSYVRPRSETDPWFWKLDGLVTDLAFLKTCLDATEIGEKEAYGKVSPYIDYGISAVWIVPAVAKVASNHEHGSSFSTLATSVAYDIAIMTGPLVWNPDIDPESKLILVAGANTVLVVCAAVRAMTGGLLHDDD